MKKTELILEVVAVVWFAAPWVLVSLAWRKWTRNKAAPAFLTGNILATVSCIGLLPFAMPVRMSWEQIRVDALEYGVIVSFVAAACALFILPFAQNRAKWLSFACSLLNACLVVMFFLTLD
jgi:hypothetical protein